MSKNQKQNGIPLPVLNHTRLHISRLQEAARRCNSVMRARGNGYILSLEVRDVSGIVTLSTAALGEVQALAAEKGLHNEFQQYIEQLGGVPDFSIFGPPAPITPTQVSYSVTPELSNAR